RLILTASGGPFRDLSADRFRAVTAKDALAHPTWRMGAKNTIDSATLMNKGLEVVEAHWLYDVDYDRISVAVHPQSIVHSLVEFVDGSLKAQLGHPDMRIPIQYALTYPRRAGSRAPRLDLVETPPLAFERPDEARFPLLRIAREAGEVGPRATAALISADEVAVGRFLDGSLDFPGIADLVSAAVERFGGSPGAGPPALDELIALDEEVRAFCAASGATAETKGTSS
ncbi:MAG: 1-deoxy-D-xylulose-5-phosphate reductoisomerase, partial [Actinomycetota bacterium]|nr:1-deoxy-D-xylulose-5-phosphate reductoisomerase [Actinomycetota bacterium]